MEFSTEEEMREMLGDDAKGYNVGSGWRSCESVEREEETPKSSRKVFISTFVGNNIMYLANKGTTFVAANAKQFDDGVAVDKKISMMNQRGCYRWKKMPVR